MPRLFPLVWRAVYARYVLASTLALAADIGSFLLLLRLSVAPVAAAVAGYGVGLCLHWLVSSRAVFTDAPDARHPWRRKAMFAASALAGLAITAMIVAASDASGIDPRWGKAVAVLASFHIVYLIRKHHVFR